MEVVLVRHAQPRVDPDLPASQWTLSPAGVRAAERVASQLDVRSTGVISSDETKAVQTAQPISRSLNVAVETDRRLREASRPWTPVGYGQLARRWLTGVEVEGWESRRRVIERMEASVTDAAAAGGSIVVLVGHGLALTAWLTSHFAHLDPVVFWTDLTMPDVWHVDDDDGFLQRALR